MKEEQGEGYLIKKWVLEKPQQVMGKMNRVQKMLEKFQQVHGQDKLRLQKMLEIVPAGHGQDKQDPGGARQAPAG